MDTRRIKGFRLQSKKLNGATKTMDNRSGKWIKKTRQIPRKDELRTSKKLNLFLSSIVL
jgi:hypothetical protein